MKVKGRGSADGEPSFGPALPNGTRWLLRRKFVAPGVICMDERIAIGSTAFAAAASVGWSLGECISIEPMKEEK